MSDRGICCPQCGSVRLRVKDSRPRGNSIVRCRQCNACGARFRSYEYSEADLRSLELDPRLTLRAVRVMASQMLERINEALRDE
jgi:hypothetical protein